MKINSIVWLDKMRGKRNEVRGLSTTKQCTSFVYEFTHAFKP